MISNWFDSLLEFFNLARFSRVDFLDWQLKSRSLEIDQLKIDNAYLFCENKKLKHDLDLWKPVEELKSSTINFNDPVSENDIFKLPPIQSLKKPKKGKKNASKSKSKKKG